MNRLVCITGLVGAGKSLVSDYFVEKGQYHFFRFGQIVIDEVKKRGLPPTETNQKLVREELRQKHGMAVMAKLNLPRIRQYLTTGSVVGDGLYSFDEYLLLKQHFPNQFTVISVFAPPKIRYRRVSLRKTGPHDPDLRQHEFTADQARQRDINELTNLNKGATIAMADYTVDNSGTLENLYPQLEKILTSFK